MLVASQYCEGLLRQHVIPHATTSCGKANKWRRGITKTSLLSPTTGYGRGISAKYRSGGLLPRFDKIGRKSGGLKHTLAAVDLVQFP